MASADRNGGSNLTGAANSAGRRAMLGALASAMDALERPHPVRVAVDGVGASGKTVLADELVGPLERLGRPVIRVSIDGFHRPRARRHARGGTSPEGYLHDSFDYDAVRSEVLVPLGPGGSLVYRPAVFDFRTDRAVDSPELTADARAVLLFEGVFMLRPELLDHWDFTVFVDTGFDVTLSRALKRDLRLFGTEEAVRRRYEERYIPGERLYLELYRPRARADVIVHNDDPQNATLEWAG